MQSIEKTRVSDRGELEELTEVIRMLMDSAEETSQGLEGVLRTLDSLQGELPSGCQKDAGLEAQLKSYRGRLVKGEYGELKEKVFRLASKFAREIDSADIRAMGIQHEANTAVAAAGRKAEELTELVKSGVLGLSYEAFSERLLVTRVQSITEERKRTDPISPEELYGVRQECPMGGDPVNLRTGNFLYTREDLSLEGEIPLSFRRTYNGLDKTKGVLGRGWRHTYEKSIHRAGENLVFNDGDGCRRTFRLRGEQGAEKQYGSRLKEEMLQETKDGFLLERGTARLYFNKEGIFLRQENPAGRGYHLTYQEGRLQSIASSHGESLQFSYTHLGYPPVCRLENVTDHTGRKISFAYQKSRLAEAVDARGGIIGYTYGENNRMKHIISQTGIRTVENEYDANKRVQRQRLPDGGEYRFSYDQSAPVPLLEQPKKQSFLPELSWEEIPLDEAGRIRSLPAPGGGTYGYAYDKRGNITALTQPDGTTTTYGYDALNRPLWSCDGRGNCTHYAYDREGRLVATTDPYGNTQKRIYTPEGHLESLKDYNGAVYHFTYDPMGRVRTTRDPEGYTTAYTYDQQGHLIRTVAEDGGETAYAYDGEGRLMSITNPAGETLCYRYGEEGRLCSVTAPEGTVSTPEQMKQQIRETMELLRMAEKEEQEKAQPKEPLPCQREKDPAGNLVRKILPGGSTYHYTYDQKNRLLSITDPEGHTRRRTLDALGNTLSYTDGRGNTTHYAYDKKGNLSAVTDALGGVTAYTRDPCGRLLKSQRMGEETNYERTPLGEILKITRKGPSPGSDQEAQAYTWKQHKPPVRAEATETAAVTVPLTKSHDSQGRLTEALYPGGIRTFWRYDSRGRMTELVHKDRAGELDHFYYLYDGEDNLIKEQIKRRGMETENGTRTYTYDPLNRLETVAKDGILCRRYGYDARGNRIRLWEKQEAGSRETLYTYNGAGQLLRTTEKSHRAGQTSLVKQTEYCYNEYGNVCREIITKAGQTIEKDLPEERALEPPPQTAPCLLLTDRLGSPLRIFSPEGKLLGSRAYEEFGLPVWEEGISHPAGWLGGRKEKEDYLRLGCRLYHPRTGRFLSPDPEKGLYEDPQTQNSYTYAFNRPLTYVDKTGAWPQNPSPYLTGSMPEPAGQGYGAARENPAFQEPIQEGNGYRDYDREKNRLAHELEQIIRSYQGRTEGTGMTTGILLFAVKSWQMVAGSIPFRQNEKSLAHADGILNGLGIFWNTDLKASFRIEAEELWKKGKKYLKTAQKELILQTSPFITKNLKNETVLESYEFMRKYTNTISETAIQENSEANRKLFQGSGSVLSESQFIENQAQWAEVKFGIGDNNNMAYSGCGIIAVYNARKALGESVVGENMVDLISTFERDGAARNGAFGTAPGAARDYFEQRGYDVIMTASEDSKELNELGEQSDTVILTAYNNQNDLSQMLHTVCITKDEKGKYWIHNGYEKKDEIGEEKYISKGKGEDGFDTLQEAIGGLAEGAKAVSVIGISRPMLGDFPESRWI